MITPDLLRAAFDAAEPYAQYVQSGDTSQQESWKRIHDRATLTQPQRDLLGSFSRRVNVLVLSGMWCGDCAQQCPFFAHFAGASKSLDIRFADRDEQKALSDAVKISGGNRVPTVIFMNEDFEFVGIAGDKSLSRLRALAAKTLGAACPIPGAAIGTDELAAGLQDWLNDFERVHLLLRLSPKLRQRHAD
jgi:thiol-disulfide isomerase/thioredoxin